jgi:putative glutamine amidotransferase
MTEKSSVARRPLIAIPARFSPNATALRYEAEVTARALVQAVFAAGGEPVVVHPYAPHLEIDVDAARERIWFADGVLLPGGGDVAAWWSGQQPHPTQYGVDEEQDAFDLAVARVALDDHLPLLAICRGTQIVNVALGGRPRPGHGRHGRQS